MADAAPRVLAANLKLSPICLYRSIEVVASIQQGHLVKSGQERDAQRRPLKCHRLVVVILSHTEHPSTAGGYA
jgi:hypothetical protein